jgi:hypothetical protein
MAKTAKEPVSASKQKSTKYKKAPDAPKRFKSAFIIFSADKHKEIKQDLQEQGRTEKVRRNKYDYNEFLDRCQLTNLTIFVCG